VQDKACIVSNPNLQAAQVGAVVGVQTEADEVIVIEEDEDPAGQVCLVVGCSWEPAEGVAIKATSRVAKLECADLVIDWKVSCDGESQRCVWSRVHS